MSFDVLAPHYRWMEWVSAGDLLQRCRMAHLARVPAAQNILILGEGNGRFLLECRRQFPRAAITVMDASACMLELARKRLTRHGVKNDRIDFIRADALTWKPPAQAFDLIVTHFFLDCFRPDQLEELVSKLARAAAPNAHWLLADFQAAPAGWRRQRSRAILWLMYRFFIAATRLPARSLTSPDNLLEKNGFYLHAREIYDWELLHSDCWQLRE
jgi:ubiquinone/menaquinone biosynthesis C-methylase UbiE